MKVPACTYAISVCVTYGSYSDSMRSTGFGFRATSINRSASLCSTQPNHTAFVGWTSNHRFVHRLYTSIAQQPWGALLEEMMLVMERVRCLSNILDISAK